MTLKSGDGHSHSEIGFAGTRRSDAKGHSMGTYGFDVSLLAHRFRTNALAAKGKDNVLRHARSVPAPLEKRIKKAYGILDTGNIAGGNELEKMLK